MSRIIANVLAAGAAGLVIVSMAAVASAGPVELAPAALDTVTAGAVGNATASAAAIGTASTASTVTNTLAVKVPYASASAAAAGAGAGAANVAGDARPRWRSPTASTADRTPLRSRPRNGVWPRCWKPGSLRTSPSTEAHRRAVGAARAAVRIKFENKNYGGKVPVVLCSMEQPREPGQSKVLHQVIAAPVLYMQKGIPRFVVLRFIGK